MNVMKLFKMDQNQIFETIYEVFIIKRKKILYLKKDIIILFQYKKRKSSKIF